MDTSRLVSDKKSIAETEEKSELIGRCLSSE